MRTKKWIYIFRVATTAYLVVAFFYFLGKPAGIGDEALFMSDLNFIKSEGWLAAIEKGISIPYMMLTYPFTFLMKNYIALRLVNIILFFLLFWYFYKAKSLKNWNFYFIILFYYSTVGHFLMGLNDTLFTIGLTIFFTETYFLISSDRKQGSIPWLLTGLIIAFFTRFMFVVFMPAVILCLALVFKSVRPTIRNLSIPIIITVILLCVNIPSLLKHHKLSYDQKDPPSNVASNWAQRQYYAQLLVNEGSLSNYNHPTWEQTDEYLAINGFNSLPSGIISGLAFDWKLSLKEFIKDLKDIAFFGTRQLGLILPIVLFFGAFYFYKNKRIDENSIIPLVLAMMIGIFAFIIISFVELRWLSAVFLASIFFFNQLVKKRKLPRIVINLNYIVITLLSCYGIYGLIGKL